MARIAKEELKESVSAAAHKIIPTTAFSAASKSFAAVTHGVVDGAAVMSHGASSVTHSVAVMSHGASDAAHRASEVGDFLSRMAGAPRARAGSHSPRPGDAGGAGAAAAEAHAEPPPPPAIGGGHMSPAIENAMKLRESGAITDEELRQLMQKDMHLHGRLSPASRTTLLGVAAATTDAEPAQVQQDPRIKTRSFDAFAPGEGGG